LLQSDCGYVLLLNEATRRYGSAQGGMFGPSFGEAPVVADYWGSRVAWHDLGASPLELPPKMGVYGAIPQTGFSPQALGPGVRPSPSPERTAWAFFARRFTRIVCAAGRSPINPATSARRVLASPATFVEKKGPRFEREPRRIGPTRRWSIEVGRCGLSLLGLRGAYFTDLG
jgi:hypothetical protein